MKSVIQRATNTGIVREQPTKGIRSNSEVQAAYAQVGVPSHHDVKSWYRDIYEFYQNNEC